MLDSSPVPGECIKLCWLTKFVWSILYIYWSADKFLQICDEGRIRWFININNIFIMHSLPSELGLYISYTHIHESRFHFFPSVLWHCWFTWLGNSKGIQPVKKTWWWRFDWSFARPIAPVVNTTSIILCFNKPANPGSPGEWPLKWRERERERERERDS